MRSTAEFQRQFPYFRFELRGSAFLPFGHWRDHIYQESDALPAANLDVFGAGGGGGAEMGLQLREYFGMIVGFSGTSLSTREWEEYAAEHDSRVETRAALWVVHFSFVFDMLSNPRFALEARLGGAAVFPIGHEELLDYEVETELAMLESTGGLLCGIAGAVALRRWLDFTFGIDLITGFNGVRYSDSDERTIVGFTLSAGLRFVGSRQRQPRQLGGDR